VLEAQASRSDRVGVLEPFPEYNSLKKLIEVETAVHSERRRKPRTDLHWAVRLIRDSDQEPVECVTSNLSSEGFYCLCEESFVPGEFVECTILIPARTRNTRKGSLSLRCFAQVVRVDSPVVDGRSGIGCHIENYRILPPDFPEGV
jgi:hypothetical protein